MFCELWCLFFFRYRSLPGDANVAESNHIKRGSDYIISAWRMHDYRGNILCTLQSDSSSSLAESLSLPVKKRKTSNEFATLFGDLD